MSKKVKRKRKQPKLALYKGWPIEKLRCFSDHNQAIFFMEDPQKSLKIGICVGVNSDRWPDSEMDNVEAIFDQDLYINIDNHIGELGKPAKNIPTRKQLEDADWWVDREKYLEYEKIYDRSPFWKERTKDEDTDLAQQNLDIEGGYR